MSTRVHSNIGFSLNRRLPQPFSAKALGTADPNTLNTSHPSKRDAMALCRHAGLLSFAHDGAGDIDVTAWFWSEAVFAATAGVKGWIHLGAVTAEYQKTVSPYSAATITCPEGALIFLQGSAAADNLYMGGAGKYPDNINNDL